MLLDNKVQFGWIEVLRLTSVEGYLKRSQLAIWIPLMTFPSWGLGYLVFC